MIDEHGDSENRPRIEEDAMADKPVIYPGSVKVVDVVVEINSKQSTRLTQTRAAPPASRAPSCRINDDDDDIYVFLERATL